MIDSHIVGCDLPLLEKEALINEWQINQFGHRQSLLR